MMIFSTSSIGAATAAISSLLLAATTLTAPTSDQIRSDVGGIDTGSLGASPTQVSSLPMGIRLAAGSDRAHQFTVTAPRGIEMATVGLNTIPVEGSTGHIGLSPVGLLPGDIAVPTTRGAEIIRQGMRGSAANDFGFELAPSDNAFGRFTVQLTAESSAITNFGMNHPLSFGGSVEVMVRTRLDLDGNGAIDQNDLVTATSMLTTADARADFNQSGAADSADLLLLVSHMGLPLVEMNQGSAPVVSGRNQIDPTDAGFGGDIEPPRPAATSTVSGGGAALQNAINSATAGDTLLVNTATYDPIVISKALTIVANTGQTPTISGIGGASGSAVVQMRVSNTTLMGFTILGGGFGVVSKDPFSTNPLTNQVLSELVILTDSGNSGHGVVFERTTDSRIDEVTVTRATDNGIFLDLFSHRNMVNHCSVLTTERQHAYAIKNSDDNIISHCTSTSAFFDSVIVLGGDRNVIKDNTFSGHLVDGIVLTDDALTAGGTGESSSNNCVLRNHVFSTGFQQGRSNGTGIWMNSESNSNLIRGNFIRGHAENGLAIFNADDNVVEGNFVESNGQGGIIIWDAAASRFAASTGGRPTNNLIRGNDFRTYTNNGAVNIRDADGTEIRNNFMRNNAGGTGNAGVIIDEPSPPSFTPTAPSTGTLIVGNTLEDLPITLLSREATTGTKYYQNKHFNTGVTQIFPPAEVDFDADVTLGGNHWPNFAASGNPSRITPYSDIVIDLIGNRGGPYQDRYPFQSEALGKSYTPEIISPLFSQTANGGPGHVFPEGSRLLIEWKVEAGRFVDIQCRSQSTGQSISIAVNDPNTGFNLWEIPTGLLRANDYIITISVKDSNRVTQGSQSTQPFGIGSPGLTLLSPVDFDSVNQGGTIRIHFNNDTATTGNNSIIYMVRDALAPVDDFNVVNSNYNATTDSRRREFIDFNLSSLPTFTQTIFANVDGGGNPTVNGNDPRNPTYYFQVGITTGSGNGFSPTDFSDGRMRIQAANAASTLANAYPTISNSNLLKIDECQTVEWYSPFGSETVDIEVFEGSSYRTIRSGLKDVGYFFFPTPELATNGAKFRVTFKTTEGVSLGSIETSPIDIVYNTNPGTPQQYFRFYNLVTTQHLYTSLVAERDALQAAVGVWLREADQGQIWNGLATVNGVKTVPYYRLFNTVTQRHLWTTDRNEYFTLREQFKDSWVAEGVDGYLLPASNGGTVPGAVPLYRLRFATGLPRQHWTTDLNEYNTLPTRGWVQENIVGYLLP